MSGCNVIIETLFPELAESEDEKIRQFLIHEVTETSDKFMSYRNMNKKDVLAWLEKQGEQKPAWSEEDVKIALRTEYEKGRADAIAEMQMEWSEEDEKILEIITSVLQVNFESTERFSGYEEYMNVDLINWLKSLRPQNHWKPSDEQMKILLQAVAYFGVSWVNKDYLALQSLYFDLKKLKEE